MHVNFSRKKASETTTRNDVWRKNLKSETEEVTALSQLLFELREKVKELEVGTATSLRSERERKDKEIAELRRELDEVC